MLKAPGIGSRSLPRQTTGVASARRRGPRLVGPGAAAGALAAVAFAAVHALWITDIWFSVVPMMIAGAVCGAAIGWSYGRLFEPSPRTWLLYNASYVVALGVLGLVSMAVFQPRTTMAELFTLDGPPMDLIGAALPLTVAFTLLTAVVLSALFGRTRSAFGAILVTCAVLVALLGLDVSVIGFIRIPADSLYAVLVFAGLIVVLAGSFATAAMGLAWGGTAARSLLRHLRAATGSDDSKAVDTSAPPS